MRILTLGIHDVHVPFQSRKWERTMHEFLNKEKPSEIVLNGDIVDFHALSQHRRNPKWEDNLETEISGIVTFLTNLRNGAPRGCRIRYIEGNHEARWNSYVQGRAPVMRMIGVDWDKYLGLADLDIQRVKAGIKVPCGQGQRVTFYHGHEGRLGSSKFPGGTALKFVAEHGCNVHLGHTHRLGMMQIRVGGRYFYGVEGGYGGDIRKAAFDFINGRKPPWALAFTYYDSEQTASPFPNIVRIK